MHVSSSHFAAVVVSREPSEGGAELPTIIELGFVAVANADSDTDHAFPGKTLVEPRSEIAALEKTQ